MSLVQPASLANGAESSHTLRERNELSFECQVSGCAGSLPKAYHKRFRICRAHASLPQMVVNGHHMRFCQQCGRFQPLGDFDGARRSCRMKLKSHNARRKEARAARQVNPPGPSTARRRRVDAAQLDDLDFPERIANGGSNNNSDLPSPCSDELLSEQLPTKQHSSESHPGGSGGRFSLQSWSTSTSGGAAPTTTVGGYSPTQPYGSEDAVALGGISFNIPLYAPNDNASLDLGVDPGLDGDDAYLEEALAELLCPMLPEDIPQQFPPPQQASGNAAPLPLPPPPLAPPSLEEALTALAEPLPAFDPPLGLVRSSFKLFNVHPDQLPPQVANALQQMLDLSVSQTYFMPNVRPGCTYITMDALLTPDETARLRGSGSKGLLDAALACGPALIPPAAFDGPDGYVMSQIGTETSVVGADIQTTVTVTNNIPSVAVVLPLAALPGDRVPFAVLGDNLASSNDWLVCRRGEATPDLEVLRSGGPAEEGGHEWIQFAVWDLEEGLHFLEAQRGALLSGSAPFVAIDDTDAVAELRQLEAEAAADPEAVNSLVRSVGVVLEHQRRRTGATSSESSDARVAAVARSVAATCLVRCWPALLRHILPATVPVGCSPAEALEERWTASPRGFGLLHLAVLSRRDATLPVLAQWAETVGHTWRCEPAAGRHALTPLHLAALLDDGGAMASALTSLFAGGEGLWLVKGTGADPTPSPAEFAAMVDNAPVLMWLQKQGIAGEEGLVASQAGGSSARREVVVEEEVVGPRQKVIDWPSVVVLRGIQHDVGPPSPSLIARLLGHRGILLVVATLVALLLRTLSIYSCC